MHLCQVKLFLPELSGGRPYVSLYISKSQDGHPRNNLGIRSESAELLYGLSTTIQPMLISTRLISLECSIRTSAPSVRILLI